MAYNKTVHVFNTLAAAWAAHGYLNTVLGIPGSADVGVQNASDVFMHPDGFWYIDADDTTQQHNDIMGVPQVVAFPEPPMPPGQ